MSISLFLLLGCEKDENNVPKNSKAISIEHITLSSISENKIVYEKLTNPKSRVNSKNSNRLINDTINNFSIETEYGFYIKSGDYESYTFEVFRENGSDFLLENVVVSKNPDATYQTILYQYTITSDELEAYRNGEYINFIGKSNKIVLENSSISSEIAGKYYIGDLCYEDISQFVPSQNCTAGGNHAYGDPSCLGTGFQAAVAEHYVTISLQVSCDEGGGGGTTSSSGNSIITSPTTMTAAQRKVKAFKMQLNGGQNSCLMGLPPNVQAELQSFVAYTLLPLEDGTTATTENPVHSLAEEMMAQMCSNSGVFNSITPLLIEKKIDDTLLNPCSKDVFQQIKNSTNNDFATVLAKLDAKNSIYNTTMISAVAPSGRPGQTVKTSLYNYTIYISTDYAGKTKLFIAATIMHELIHAYFMSLFDDYHNGNPSNPNAYNEFAILFQYYVNKTYPGSSDVAHHEQMALKYVNAIAAALKEYAIATGTPSTFPNLDQICSDLAWGGLQEAPIFNNPLGPLSPSDRARIINRYKCENLGNSYGYDNPPVQTPIGQPCN